MRNCRHEASLGRSLPSKRPVLFRMALEVPVAGLNHQSGKTIVMLGPSMIPCGQRRFH
jgi:hypothetical protein